MDKSPINKFLVIFLFTCCGISLGQTIYIPTNDIVIVRIEELMARGYLDGLSRTEKPWIASHVVQNILDDELMFDSQSKLIADDILSYLRATKIADKGVLDVGTNIGLGIRAGSREQRDGYFYQNDIFINRGFKKEFGSIYDFRFWISRDSKWGIDTRLIFDSDGTGFPWYYGTAHNARIIGQFDHAYLTFSFDKFSALLGRQRLVWGPSPRGSLLLNDTSPPLDMIRYDFSVRPLSVTGFATRLDDYVDSLGVSSRRYLSGHRLRINPGKGWEIALSEIYLYGGPNRLPELYYNIPVVLYYWEAQNRRQDDNALWGLDISWLKGGLGQFYTQFVFDDIQRQNRGPQKIGMQFGAYLSPSQLRDWSGIFEINFVDTYVYGHRQRLNAYLNWDRPLGRLDSDQREYFAGVFKRLNPAIKFGVEFIGRDKGAYYAVDPQPNAAPLNTRFPSGAIEYTRELSLVSTWEGSGHYFGRLALGYQSIAGWQHSPGLSLDQFLITFQAFYGAKIGLPFWNRFR